MTIRGRFLMFFGAGLITAVIAATVLFVTDVFTVNAEVPVAQVVLAGIAAVALVGAALVGVMMVARSTDRQLRQLARGISEIAEGNLSPRLPENAPVEFAGISTALSSTCDQLAEIASQLTDLASRVTETTDGASDTFEGVREGARVQSTTASRTFDAVGRLSEELLEVSRGIESLARSIDANSKDISNMDVAIAAVAEMIVGLSRNIEQASTATQQGDQNTRVLTGDVADLSSRVSTAQGALAEMVAGAQKARTDARDTARIMGRLQEEAERFGKAIEAVIQGSAAVQQSNESILQVTATLESRVDRVDDVVEVIGNLAERTKLLSINASIIASEAGEHGRAFAVVANEVKDLAQSTAGAISEISTIVVGLKEGFAQTVETIQRGQDDVERGTSLARDAVVLLRSIPEEVDQAAARADQIAARTERGVVSGEQVEAIIGQVVSTLGRVRELLTEQVSRNEGALDVFRNIRATAEQALGSARDHTSVTSEVTQSVAGISSDFRALATRVRDNVSSLDNIVALSEEVLTVTDSNRRRVDSLAELVNELGRHARSVGEGARQLGSESVVASRPQDKLS